MKKIKGILLFKRLFLLMASLLLVTSCKDEPKNIYDEGNVFYFNFNVDIPEVEKISNFHIATGFVPGYCNINAESDLYVPGAILMPPTSNSLIISSGDCKDFDLKSIEFYSINSENDRKEFNNIYIPNIKVGEAKTLKWITVKKRSGTEVELIFDKKSESFYRDGRVEVRLSGIPYKILISNLPNGMKETTSSKSETVRLNFVFVWNYNNI